MNVAKIREDVTIEDGDRVSLIWQDKEITSFQYNSESRKLVSVLKGLGIKRGDRIVVQMPNCIEVLQTIGATWRMGCVCVPINYLMGDEEIAHIYKDSGAKAVVTSKLFLPRVLQAKKNAPELKHVILIDEDDIPDGTLSFHEMVNSAQEDPGIVETDDDENAALIYTAGTTGHPKGVVLTHYAMYANAKMQYETLAYPHGLTSALVLPLCHSFGIAIMNSGMFRRKTKSVILSTYDVDTIFATIEKYKVQFFAGVPTMYVLMLLHPDPKKYDLSSMQYWSCGSAPLSMATWKQFKDVFGGEIREGWGLTEAGANNTANPLDGQIKVGSIGLPMKGTDIRIKNDDGSFAGANEQGEIVIKGPSIMKEYWNMPEETAQAIVDGWLHTGDVGYYDDDGYFWITDRKKDLIIKGGENISPRTIEEVLYQHPKVAEAAVIAMDDQKYGEDIKAFLVLKPEQKATQEEIIEHCKGHLTNFLLPREVVFLDAFPKSLVGKILKKELRKM